jgi:AcrR family transcriptional regulator
MTNDTAIRIFQQAHQLFMQYGLKSVSMDDIANKMGISKKTIYQFYADKEALVSEVVKQITSNNQLQCDNDISNSENAIHEIILAMEQMSKLFETMNPSILFDLQKYYPQAFKYFQTHKNDYVYGKIKQNITRGIKEGLYRPDLNIEIVSKFRVESIVIAFNPEFQTSVKSGLVSIAQELSTFFLHGFVNEKGLKLITKYTKNRSKK